MVRICHVLSDDVWAGAEVMAFTLLKGLKHLQLFDLSIILFNERRLAAELRDLGLAVYIVDESKLDYLKCLKVVRQIVAEISPDIIHSHGFKEGVFSFIGALGRKKCKLIATQHSLPLNPRGKFALKPMLKIWSTFRLQSIFFNKIIAVSMDIQEKLVSEHNFQRSDLAIIYNGIEIQNDLISTSSKNQFIIGAAARFFPVKDYPFLIEVARICKDLEKDIVFRLAGDGPGIKEIQRLIYSYNLETRCKLLGHVDEMQGFYNDIDIFINTSIHEGIPMSILEAMSYGKPVVAPNVGGIGEIFKNGTAGFLIDQRNPITFARRCIQLATDSILYEKMSQLARNRVKKCFSMESMVSAYIDLYMRSV